MTAFADLLEKNQPKSEKPKSGRGGPRPGSGRPLGSISEARKAELKAEATLKQLAAHHTSEAVKTLVELFKSTETPPAARVAAIKELLDRGHGKATQKVEGGDPANPINIKTRIEVVIVEPQG